MAADTPTSDGPTPDELARWNAHRVVKFRKSLAPWLACFVAFIVVNLAGGPNLLAVSAFWGIGIATGYARLWADGYDWRDVFRHPRDTMFVDVVSDTLDEFRSIKDASKRAQVRERARRARLRRGEATGAGGVPVARGAAVVLPAGPLAEAVRQAQLDRDEALRLYDDLSREDRARLPEVPASVTRLAEAVATLARQVAAADRDLAGRDVAAIAREIDALEAAANPLDVAASETRARRLAQLKRERHGAAGASDERTRRAARLESACLALRNMRFDLLRLKTGAHGWQQVTTIAEQAMALAREVDAQVHAGDEMARLARRPAARD
jgi:serine/threonine-protein kinase